MWRQIRILEQHVFTLVFGSGQHLSIVTIFRISFVIVKSVEFWFSLPPFLSLCTYFMYYILIKSFTHIVTYLRLHLFSPIIHTLRTQVHILGMGSPSKLTLIQEWK